MRTICGVAASKGIAIGKLCIRQNPAEMKNMPPAAVQTLRFSACMLRARQQSGRSTSSIAKRYINLEPKIR